MKSSLIHAGECFGDRGIVKEALEACCNAAKCDEKDNEKEDFNVERVLAKVLQIKEKIETEDQWKRLLV